MRLGMPREFFSQLQDQDVSRALAETRKLFEDLGAKFVELSLPHLDYGIAAYYVIAPSEASSNLARYDGVKYGHRAEKFDGMIDMYCKTRAEDSAMRSSAGSCWELTRSRRAITTPII